MKEKHPFHAIQSWPKGAELDPDHSTENSTLFFSFIVTSSAPCGDFFGPYENPKHVNCSKLKVDKLVGKVWGS